MIVADRVRKHRTNLPGQNRCRMETSVRQATIGQIRTVAKNLRIPVSRAIENALKTYLEEYVSLVAGAQRLGAEKARLLPLQDRPEYQAQLLQYNEQLTAHQQRVRTLIGIPASAE